VHVVHHSLLTRSIPFNHFAASREVLHGKRRNCVCGAVWAILDERSLLILQLAATSDQKAENEK
jgi:hypothetical protein